MSVEASNGQAGLYPANGYPGPMSQPADGGTNQQPIPGWGDWNFFGAPYGYSNPYYGYGQPDWGWGGTPYGYDTPYGYNNYGNRGNYYDWQNPYRYGYTYPYGGMMPGPVVPFVDSTLDDAWRDYWETLRAMEQKAGEPVPGMDSGHGAAEDPLFSGGAGHREDADHSSETDHAIDSHHAEEAGHADGHGETDSHGEDAHGAQEPEDAERFAGRAADATVYSHHDFAPGAYDDRNLRFTDAETHNAGPLRNSGDPMVLTGAELNQSRLAIDGTRHDSDTIASVTAYNSTLDYQGRNDDEDYLRVAGNNNTIDVNTRSQERGSARDTDYILTAGDRNDVSIKTDRGADYIQSTGNDGTVEISTGLADDVIAVSGEHLNEEAAGRVNGGEGHDDVLLTVSHSRFDVRGGEGHDNILVSGDHNETLHIAGGEGKDQVAITGSHNDAEVDLGEGKNTFHLAGSHNTVRVEGSEDRDAFYVAAGPEDAENHVTLVTGNDGHDRIYLEGAGVHWDMNRDDDHNRVYTDAHGNVVTVIGDGEVHFTGNTNLDAQERVPVRQRIEDQLAATRQTALERLTKDIGTQAGQEVSNKHFGQSGAMDDFQELTGAMWLS